MKELSEYINKNSRIIEFNIKNSYFQNQTINAENLLSIFKNGNGKENTNVTLNKENFITAIRKNSSDVIVLNSSGWKEIKSLQKTAEAKLFFERITLINIIPIIYFLIKGFFSQRTKYHGLFYLKKGASFSLYFGFKKRKKKKRATRHYLSPLVGAENFFQELKKKNISYCVLRWFNNLPFIEENEDVDILVEDSDLARVHSLIDKKPGIIPFDIYSKTGLPGSDFNHLPYYVYSLAERVLKDSILYKGVYKVPTPEIYFYLLAYHVVFHKGENSGIQSKQYKVAPTIKSDHDYLYHLKTISSQANIDRNDFTLEGLHSYLENKGYAPQLDTQYKLSLQNQYLKAYLEDVHHQSELLKNFEGLVCFVIREKITEAGFLEDAVKFIQKAGFTIIQTTMLDESLKDQFTKHVRGGNWNQGPWPSNAGNPSAIVVAFDVLPIKPDPHDHKKHPGLTNKRILGKSEIRKFLNMMFPDKTEWCNGIHSSDNEIQAVEYLTLAGLDEDVIGEAIQKYKNAFDTQYPVLDVLSCYSRRAKIELISYHGKKAIMKTFKPTCELFLSNEIEAYTIFKDLDEVPELLETGENYFITSFIEGSKPLGHRIDVRTLKRCLNLLHKIFDRGYSLLDFKPSNFLIDKSKNIHLIDFEFLHKYADEISFLECYDLVGAPDSIDLLHKPIVKIPKGKKQFDVKWGSFTGLRYEDLSNLNTSHIYFKSFSRFYYSKIKKLLRTNKNKVRRRINMIFKALP